MAYPLAKLLGYYLNTGGYQTDCAGVDGQQKIGFGRVGHTVELCRPAAHDGECGEDEDEDIAHLLPSSGVMHVSAASIPVFAGRLLCLALLAAVFGCGAKWSSSSDLAASGQNVPPEATLDEQIAAVRAGRSQKIVLSETPAFDADVRRLEDLSALTHLSLAKANLSPAGFESLSRLKNLESLTLGNVRPDDAAASKLSQLKNLTTLNLDRTRITDAGLAALAQLDKLDLLRLGSSQVTDDGLDVLTSLPELRYLFLQNARLTDHALAKLKQLKQLDSLYLEGNGLSDQAVAEAFPELHVHW